jgi:hypothetical protein
MGAKFASLKDLRVYGPHDPSIVSGRAVGSGRQAARSGGAEPAARPGLRTGRDRTPRRCRASAPRSPRYLRGRKAPALCARALDGGCSQLRAEGRAQSPERGGALGDPAGEDSSARGLRPRTRDASSGGHRGPPEGGARGVRRDATRRRSGHGSGLHPDRHRNATRPRSTRGGDQRSRQEGSHQSRGPTVGGRRDGSTAGDQTSPRDARPPHIHVDGLGARAPLPDARSRGRPSHA